MVCEKNSDTYHDFDNDPIVPRIEGEWVKATGTTLGADDGIGIAAQLAILEAVDIEHGPLEMLFTVDEETGLTGAKGLKPGFLKGRILLNLDSEDEGELFIGCAGGQDTKVFMSYSRVAVNYDFAGYQIKVSGLQGGHSGDDINKGRGNAVKIINRLLWTASHQYEVRISEINGGNLRNAIAREAFANVIVPNRFNAEQQNQVCWLVLHQSSCLHTLLICQPRSVYSMLFMLVRMVLLRCQLMFPTSLRPQLILRR
jgi:dipeptidase D